MIEHVESRIFFPMQAVKIKKEITVASRSGCQAATPTDTQKWYSNSTFSISSLEPGCQYHLSYEKVSTKIMAAWRAEEAVNRYLQFFCSHHGRDDLGRSVGDLSLIVSYSGRVVEN